MLSRMVLPDSPGLPGGSLSLRTRHRRQVLGVALTRRGSAQDPDEPREATLLLAWWLRACVLKLLAVSMKLSILLREYATQDEHPRQDAYRVPTLTGRVRVLVTFSAGVRTC